MSIKDKNSETALNCAEKQSHKETCQFLKENGDVSQKNILPKTALDMKTLSEVNQGYENDSFCNSV